MLKILETEVITWQTMTPDTPESFPCMICHESVATIRMKCQIKTMRINIVTCQGCASLDPAELHTKLRGGQIK